MQLCPVEEKIPYITPLTAWSRSASSSTIVGDLPPSSSEIGISFSAAMCASVRPVDVPPVKVTLPTPGWRTIASPITEPRPVSTDSSPDGSAGLVDDPRQRQRHQRRPLGGLEHHRVAGRERRRDLLRVARDRRVPRGDRADHADGLVQAHREVVATRGGEVGVGASRARPRSSGTCLRRCRPARASR